MSIRLKELRSRTGLTQMQLAEAIGMEYNTYVKLENGYRGGKKETLQKIADYYQMPLPVLQYGEGGDPEEQPAIRIPIPKFFTPAQIQEVRDFIGYLEWKAGKGPTSPPLSELAMQQTEEHAEHMGNGTNTQKESIPVIKPANDIYQK